MSEGDISVKELFIKLGIVTTLSLILGGYLIITAENNDASPNDQPSIVAEADSVVGDYSQMAEDSRSVDSQIQAGSMSVADSLLPVDSTFDSKVFGTDVKCARINTDRWGYGQTFNPDQPEIETSRQAMSALSAIGYLGEKVIVIRGSQIDVVDVHDPSLSSVANRTQLCGLEPVK